MFSQLLTVLKAQEYHFQTFHENLTSPTERSIVLRHDVDKRPQNSLTLAKIENGYGIKGTCNFRAKPCSWDEGFNQEISPPLVNLR